MRIKKFQTMVPPSRDAWNLNPGPAPATINTSAVDQNTFDQVEQLQHADHVRRGKTPYLGIQARLSQVWINRWTILLLLILVRVLIMLSGLNDDLNDAKVKALAACTKVEDVGSAMASMPHYLSVGVNSLAASGISHAVHGMMTVLDMILTGVEEIILFVINMYVSTYACLIAAVIHGGLNVSAFVVTKTTDAMNDAIHGITSDLGSVISGIQKGLDDTWGQLKDDISTATFGVVTLPSEPTIDVSGDMDKLNSVTINSDGFVSDIDNLNKELPTFQDVQNFTRNAVSIPFNFVKNALNESYGDWSFDSSIFPVAQKEALSFCSDNSVINDFFQTMFQIAATAKIAFIVVLCVLAVLACVPMAYWEIRRWRHQRGYKALFVENKYDDFDLMMMGARPLTSKWGLKFAGWFAGKPSHPAYNKRHVLVRWCVAYGTSLPAIFVLSLALAGFFSCLCQYIVLAAIQKEVPALASKVGDFAGEVVSTLEKASEDWANDANGVILGVNNEINNDVLGYVTNATDAVNNTINVFTTDMNKALADVFNGTILMEPIQGVIYCLLGMKIEAVQNGLTWVHDNAKVSLPLFPNDTFSQGAQNSIDGDSDLTSFLATPSSVTSDEVTGAVLHVTNAIYNNIIQEALTSTGLLLVYIVIVLIGVVRTLSSLAMDKNEGFTSSAKDIYTGGSPDSPRQRYAKSMTEGPFLRGSGRDSNPFADKAGIQLQGLARHNVTDSTHPGHNRQSSYGETYGGEKR